ncbi:excalibur calcium-binding domain-containing protein [Streptomyces atratus]|uniref:excalibur calcium-binding domain-containing protein n=1 Tax=Streptomyces atratus TaxID=1893 RepID=UPI0036629BCB
MTQHNPGQQWGPQPGPSQARKMRKRPAFYIVVAATWALTFGCTAAAIDSSNDQELSDAKAAAKSSAAPRPTVTVTTTPKPKATVTPTVTATVTVTATATKTVTKEPEAAADDSSSGGGSSSTYYQNCAAAKADGAAPVHRGDPGYGSHLDRDGDGVGCEW